MKNLKWFDLHGQQRLAWILLALMIVAYVWVMSSQTLLRYETFKATAFDLGNMDQVLWNTAHGRFFLFTNKAIDWYGPSNRLALHVEPILLLISLLYLLHADPRMLLVFQTLMLAAGTPAVFLLSRRYLPSWPIVAVGMSMGYLLSPALLGLNLFDFHPDSLATPLLLYAILAITYRRYAWFLLLCVFASACKEDMPLIIAFFGLLLTWKYHVPRLGLVLLAGGGMWAYIAFRIVIPHFYTGVLANNFWYRYEALGNTPATAISNLLLHPWLIFTQVLTLDRIFYLFGLLRSTGFLSLLAPEWLLPALPKLASNLLSNNQPNYSGVYHYNAAIIPFVMLAAIHGTRRFLLIWQGWSRSLLRQEELELFAGKPALDTIGKLSPTRWFLSGIKVRVIQRALPSLRFFPKRCFFRPVLSAWGKAQWQHLGTCMHPWATSVSLLRLQRLLCLWLLFTLGLNFLLALPALSPFLADHLPGVHEQHIQQILALIPPDASVSASDTLNPHLSERQQLAVFPTICLNPACHQIVQYIVVDLTHLTLGNRASATSKLNALAHLQYQVLRDEDGILLLILHHIPRSHLHCLPRTC